MLCRLAGDSTMSNTSTVLSERVTCNLPLLGAGVTSRGVTSMTSSVPTVGERASGVPVGKLMATVELPGTWVSTNSEEKSPGLNAASAAAPALAVGQPYSTEHGSVEEELTARALHGHILYCTDNSSVYHYLELQHALQCMQL